jgi:putative peptide zinc metalloprotease protein
VSDRFASVQVGNQQTVTRRLLGLFMATVLSLGVGLPIAPAVAAQDNNAEAVNTKDGRSVFDLAFQVKKINGDVDATNTAVAFASCEECRTVAVAIQVVLVTGDPDSVSLENESVAINYQCTECETLAAAYQIVFAGGDDVRFTPEGKRRLRELARQVRELERNQDEMTLQEVANELAAIAGEVADVVATELVSKEKAKEEETTSSTSPSSTSTTSTVADDTTTTLDATTTTSSP